MNENIVLDQFTLGPMQNFLYLIGCGRTKQAAVVDPAWDAQIISRRVKDYGWTLAAAIQTHGHPDHINALDDLLQLHDVPVYISEHEADFYMPRHKNVRRNKPDEVITVGDLSLKAIHTPGHTPGGQCFLIHDKLLTGDTLFIDGCGRCDLPGGDAKQMYGSLYDIIMRLPGHLVVYPGHDYGPTPTATLGEQKRTNPYLQCSSLEEFLTQRMGIVL